MDGRRFDYFVRNVASRRSVLKGILGLGGAVAATRLARKSSDAAWSTEVCLPTGSGYTRRLVPTAAVPFYVQRYGAVIPSTCADYAGECGELPDGCGGTITCDCPDPECPPFFAASDGACINPCVHCLGICDCATLPNGDAFCMEEGWEWSCDSTCQSDDSICGSAPCMRVLRNIGGYSTVCDIESLDVGVCITQQGSRGLACWPISS